MPEQGEVCAWHQSRLTMVSLSSSWFGTSMGAVILRNEDQDMGCLHGRLSILFSIMLELLDEYLGNTVSC